VLGPSTVGFRFLGFPSNHEHDPSPQTAARTKTRRPVSFIGAVVGEWRQRHRHPGQAAADSREWCRFPTSAPPAVAPDRMAKAQRWRQRQESGAWQAGIDQAEQVSRESSAQLSSAQLSGAAAAAAHQRHHHPDPPAACSTGCCWSWTAAAPACVPFLRHRKATARQWQQRQESGACAEHKKASAACKLAEAGKIRISKRPDRISWWPARTGSRGHPAGCGRPEPRCPCRSRRSSGTARWRKAAPRRSGGHRASPAVWSAG
jgi:hypothetical protein